MAHYLATTIPLACHVNSVFMSRCPQPTFETTISLSWAIGMHEHDAGLNGTRPASYLHCTCSWFVWLYESLKSVYVIILTILPLHKPAPASWTKALYCTARATHTTIAQQQVRHLQQFLLARWWWVWEGVCREKAASVSLRRFSGRHDQEAKHAVSSFWVAQFLMCLQKIGIVSVLWVDQPSQNILPCKGYDPTSSSAKEPLI